MDAMPSVAALKSRWPRAAEDGLSFRIERDDDDAFVAELFASTRREEMAPARWPPQQLEAFLRQQYDAQRKHYRTYYPDADWLLIEHAAAPIGRLYLERWTSEHRIIDIALIPSARGRGFGAAILRDVLDEAAAADKAVSIHVEKNNPAMRLYRRLGFRTTADKGVYDLMEWRAIS
jgi:ribosomal protein S18 acetylase RimI-like enzyme